MSWQSSDATYHRQFIPCKVVLLALSVYRLQIDTERATRYQYLKRKAQPGTFRLLEVKKSGANTVADEVLDSYKHGKNEKKT